MSNTDIKRFTRHTHVSLRDKQGRNVFAINDEEYRTGGRKNARYEDLKYVSQECEWFLGGVLDGLQDGKCRIIYVVPRGSSSKLILSYANGLPVA